MVNFISLKQFMVDSWSLQMLHLSMASLVPRRSGLLRDGGGAATATGPGAVPLLAPHRMSLGRGEPGGPGILWEVVTAMRELE